MIPLGSLFTLAFVLTVSAVLVNHTVDDQSGLDSNILTYTPANGGWEPGQTCSVCQIHPGIIDPAKAFDGTWFYTAYNPPRQALTTIEVSFSGTAVYVFNIIPNTVPGVGSYTNLSFSLDGYYAGQYVHIPDSTQDIFYNVSVFAIANLANAAHVLTISLQGEKIAHVLFDYLIYTTDEPEPQSSRIPYISASLLPVTSASSQALPSPTPRMTPPLPSPTPRMTPPANTGVLLGGVIGGIAVLVLAGVQLFWLCTRKRHRGTRRSLDSIPTFQHSNIAAELSA
ncbi:hypothetical protein GY45DRAFT_136296 [Cubamyces sp. BRFM 1775]|nr:hypothetical protein GY45DRAFT_136296 [Cubamyces sp. BRFM 1775]